MKRFQIFSAAVALLFASEAGASQFAYVLNRTDKTISEIDLQNLSVVRHLETMGDAQDLAVDPLGRRVYVAARGILSTTDLATGREVDLDFPWHGLASTGVDLSPDGRYAWLVQRDGAVFRIEVTHAQVQQCIDARTRSCYLPTAAREYYALPIEGGEHIAVSPATGAVYVVNEDGQVAWLPAGGSGFQVLPLPQNAVQPTGMDASPGGDIVIASESGPNLTVIGPAPGHAVTTLNLGQNDLGRPGFDPRRGPKGFPIYLAHPGGGRVVKVVGGAIATQIAPSNGSDPVAAAVSFRGTLASADQGPDSAMVAVYDWAQWNFGVRAEPIDVEIGPVSGAAVAGDPGTVQWTYSSLGSWLGARTVTLRSVGLGNASISSLSITGYDAANFRVVGNSCVGRTLMPGQTCQVQVDFRAGSYDGRLRLVDASYGASLVVRHNGSPQNSDSVALTAKHWSADLKILLKNSELTRLNTFSSGG